MGYQAISRHDTLPFVAYDKVMDGVRPSPAIFDVSQGTINYDRLCEALDAAGIDREAFMAELEAMG